MNISRKTRTLLGSALAVFGVIWLGKAMAGADYDGQPSAATDTEPLIQIVLPTPPAETAPSETPSPTPLPELPALSSDAWELMTADSSHPLCDYSFERETVEGQSVDARIAAPLRAMLADLRAAGYTAFISSAWRDEETQRMLFLRAEAQYGENAALYEDAVGESEHQTGLCCDITDLYYEEKTASLAETGTLKWLFEHCHEYGFIVRYPGGKEDITAHPYEPWHFRYVGEAAAAYISAYGLTLEEFVLLLGG